MTETAPWPVLRFRHEPAPHRISVKITQLLSKLSSTPDIEVVVALLPEWFLGPQGEPACHALLQRFQRLRKRAALGFVHEQMHMLRHDDVSVHAEPVRLPDPFQRGYEDCAAFCAGELRLSAVAAESQEMTLTGLLKPPQRPRHEDRLFSRACECL